MQRAALKLPDSLIKLGPDKTGQARIGWIDQLDRIEQEKTEQIRTGLVGIGQCRAMLGRAGQCRAGQDRTGQIRQVW